MNELKLLFFALGTLGFFAAVYLSIKHPELVKAPGQLESAHDGEASEVSATQADAEQGDLRKWDKAATWLMWGGWGLTALITLIDRSGYLEVLEL